MRTVSKLTNELVRLRKENDRLRRAASDEAVGRAVAEQQLLEVTRTLERLQPR